MRAALGMRRDFESRMWPAVSVSAAAVVESAGLSRFAFSAPGSVVGSEMDVLFLFFALAGDSEVACFCRTSSLEASGVVRPVDPSLPRIRRDSLGSALLRQGPRASRRAAGRGGEDSCSGC